AGNLENFVITRANGDLVDGSRVLYGGVQAGYTHDPQENIVYVSAHDNQTLFDAIQVKATTNTNLINRIRMNNLALSFPMFSQGIPFFHAGDDMLRSKSLDDNSYDSGDWFNTLDWTYESNNWGVGLPIEGSSNWAIYKPLLGNAQLKPNTSQITFASDVFKEYLEIRKSSPLFRLTTADQVSSCVSFYNTGTKQIPGLIVMRIQDVTGLDPNYGDILVFFNANQKSITFSEETLANLGYQLHPVLVNSVDSIVKKSTYVASSGTFTIPALTTSVFVFEK
ncbi:MAG: alpha-1,6-glucosidase domain-containing protein, partial [Anaerolineaceae bacterium]